MATQTTHYRNINWGGGGGGVEGVEGGMNNGVDFSEPGIDSVGIELKSHGHIETDTDRPHRANGFIDTALISLEGG